MIQRFDVVLVLAHFRAATTYLSIIRTLSSRLRIGLLLASVDPAYLQKTIPGQKTFVHLCQKFGATLIEPAARVTAELMLIQQYHYPQHTAMDIVKRVTARKRIGMMGLASAGLEKQDSFLSLFGLQRLYVPSRRLMQFLITERGADDRYAGMEAIEVGLPFAKYPVFPEFEVDYILASPTVFSFHSETGKQHFLETVDRLLEQIPCNARIAYKPHNGNVRDYFAPKFHYGIGCTIKPFHTLRKTLFGLASRAPSRWRSHAQKIETSIRHTAILDRVIPMLKLTPYADISIEAFLPGVRSGVIGGLSNTIWGTLYSGLPYYNCVDSSLRSEQSELLPHKNSDAYLDMNLRFFGVPYCEGSLALGAHGEGIVTEADRGGDLIRSIEDELCS